MGLVEVTAPAAEPVTTDEAKTHLRVSGSDDDTYIALLVKTARQKVETDTNRSLITTTFKAVLDCFPNSRIIKLERAPLISIVSLQYYDTENTLTTLDSAQYLTQVNGEPGYVELKSAYDWPDTRDESQAVIINYTAGFGATAATVPETLKHAIKFLVSHWYSTREPVNIGNIAYDIPITYEYLVQPYRVYTND